MLQSVGSKRKADENNQPATENFEKPTKKMSGPVPMAMDVPEVTIDEDLHSRQLAVYGRETMRRLVGANILVCGLRGLGIEAAKNVVLAGVKAVAIHDTGVVEMSDLGSQFYLNESDIGKNRAQACAARLQELNPAVLVTAYTEEISDLSFLSQFQAVLVTGMELEQAIRLNDFCHKASPPIAFVRADTYGLFGTIFCDFGPQFTVFDVDGEEPHKGIIASISKDKLGFVTCVDDERLEFQDGELVTFSEVKGMTELNGVQVRVKNVKMHSFYIDLDTSNFGDYQAGGLVVQVKEPVVRKFKDLKTSLTSPGEFLLSDFSKFDRPAKLHVCYQALDKFRTEKGHLPRVANTEDAAHLSTLVKAVNESLAEPLEPVEPDLITKLAFGATASICPMVAMFGGLVGQELVKACTGKFQPLFQYFYFDSCECLPKEYPLPLEEYAPMGCRYDDQIAVFGRTMQDKLTKLNVFLVGAGALGCEFIKNFAMMGVSTSGPGKVTLTDDDVIEKSNLSRQFLFRDWDLKKPKSTAAAQAALAINPTLQVQAQQNRVSPDTEMVFDDTFWEGLDVVVNALDNVNARLYVDCRCVYFQKPLLESGTLGTKCNTQMIIPNLTENYGASRDPPEKQAPMCTLHSFPFIIDHCLTWARSEFEGLLEKTPTEANKYLSATAEFSAEVRKAGDASARETVERVLDVLSTNRCSTFEECVAWARHYFQEYFYNRIAQLVFTFPEDARTSQGALFWSAPKRFPSAVPFSSSDPLHLQFVRAGAMLKAEVHGLTKPDQLSDAQLAAMLDKVQVPDFQPKSGVKIETDPKANSASVAHGDEESVIDERLSQLSQLSLPAQYKLAPVEFEKDDDTNFHMDFISAMANLRARNYAIPEVDKLQAKLIAGRIIPAIATTTAMSTGLVCLEMYKVLRGAPMEAYRNTFANLALPLFAMAEPIAPKVFQYHDLKWTLWDRWILEGDLTVQQLLDWFVERKLTAYSVSCGNSLIYNNFFPKHQERLPKKVSDLVQEIAKLEIPASRRHFDIVVACEDEEGEDLDVPLVSIRFR